MSQRAGTFVEELTEEIDIFPSLVQLHGFDIPSDLEVRRRSRKRCMQAWPTRSVPQGRSWIPLLAGESQTRVAVSQYPHACGHADKIKVFACKHMWKLAAETMTQNCRLHGEPWSGSVMGYSIRTHQFRYSLRPTCSLGNPLLPMYTHRCVTSHRYTEWTKWDCHNIQKPMGADCSDSNPQWSVVVCSFGTMHCLRFALGTTLLAGSCMTTRTTPPPPHSTNSRT